MKATLKYDLTNDEDEFKLAVNSMDMALALSTIYHELVSKYRSSGKTDALLDEIIQVYEDRNIFKIIEGI